MGGSDWAWACARLGAPVGGHAKGGVTLFGSSVLARLNAPNITLTRSGRCRVFHLPLSIFTDLEQRCRLLKAHQDIIDNLILQWAASIPVAPCLDNLCLFRLLLCPLDIFLGGCGDKPIEVEKESSLVRNCD